MIVRALHAAIGEIERAGDRDGDAEQRRRQRQQQAAGGDGIGRHEDIGDEIDHEIEHVARPVRLQARDIEPPRHRAVDRIDHKRRPRASQNIAAQCSRTASSSASKAMPAPSAVKICTENAAARVAGDAGGESCLV